MENSLTSGPDGTTPMHIVLSETDRRHVLNMIDDLKGFMRGHVTEDLVERIVTQLASMPGADTAEAIRPLVKCLPPAIAARLPDIFAAEGAAPRTAVISYLSKDLMFRIETAVTHGKAFLALTDLECDNARQLRGY